MRRIFCMTALAAAFVLVSCGGGGDGGGPTPSFSVNAATGSDTTGDGVTVPYKTITKALSMAGYGDTVTVAPGRYDNVLGETFPIVIPQGVKLIGDEVNKGNGPTKTIIQGSGNIAVTGGSFTIYPMDNATISGFTIYDAPPANSTSTRVVFIDVNGVTVKNNRIVDDPDSAEINAYAGIWVYRGTNALISANVIQNNTEGLWFSSGGDTARVEKNEIRYNNTGVTCDSGNSIIDLGGGPNGSVGGNIIAGNSGHDIFSTMAATATIHAANNYWDHVPPTIGVGGDIDSWHSPTFITTGAMLAP